MADSNTVVGAKIEVDASGAAAASKTTKELKKDISDLRKAFEDTKEGSAEQAAAYKKLQDAQNQLKKSTDDLKKSTDDGNGGFGKIKESIGGLPGPLGGATEGVGKLNTGLLKLLANPIGLVITAIVLALTALYKAFTSTDEGAQKVKSIFDGLGAVIQELMQRALSLASAIVKLFSGDFSGAMEDGKKAVTGFGDAMVDAFKRGRDASDLLDEVEDAVRVLGIQYEAMNARLAKSKELLSDENASYKDKKKALQESAQEIEEYYKKVSENDDKRLDAIGKQYNVEKQLNDLRKKGYEAGAKDFDDYLQTLTIGEKGIKAIEDAIKQSISSRAEYSAKQRQQNRAERSLDSQERQKEKEAAQKAEEERKKREQNLLEFENALRKLQNDNRLAAIKDAYEKEQAQINIQYDEQQKTAEQNLKQKKLTEDQYTALLLQIQANRAQALQVSDDKHNQDLADKDAAFQKQLAAIRGKIAADGATSQREAERVQLKVAYAQQLADAEKAYKGNASQLAQIRNALAEQLHAEQVKLEAKFQREDADARFKAEEARLKGVADNQKLQSSQRLKAVDDEQVLVQKAFDDRLITEADYNSKVDELSKARISIREQEQQAHEKIADSIGQTFGNLSALVGKQTALGKVFAIAQATIDTYSSAVKAYNAMAGIPVVGPALGAIAAGAAVAAGISNVKKIVAVDVPGQGGGGGSATSPSPSTPAAPLAPAQISTTFNPQQSQTATTAQDNRAYVLDADVQNSADRNARLNRAARFGN